MNILLNCFTNTRRLSAKACKFYVLFNTAVYMTCRKTSILNLLIDITASSVT